MQRPGPRYTPRRRALRRPVPATSASCRPHKATANLRRFCFRPFCLRRSRYPLPVLPAAPRTAPAEALSLAAVPADRVLHCTEPSAPLRALSASRPAAATALSPRFGWGPVMAIGQRARARLMRLSRTWYANSWGVRWGVV